MYVWFKKKKTQAQFLVGHDGAHVGIVPAGWGSPWTRTRCPVRAVWKTRTKQTEQVENMAFSKSIPAKTLLMFGTHTFNTLYQQ